MRDAPEKIWATPDIYERVDWRFGEWAEQEPDTKTKMLYRRADLPLTTDQLLADPRVKALVEAAMRSLSEAEPLWVPAMKEALIPFKEPKE
jgi:hypothetical protein